MADIGDDFFSFGGAVPTMQSPNVKGAQRSADDLWYHEGRETYENTDGVITHIAAKASGSCPYMRELLGLPPLPSAQADGANPSSPPLSGLNQSFANSPNTPAAAAPQPQTHYHQHHPAHTTSCRSGCPYMGHKTNTGNQEAPMPSIDIPPSNALPKAIDTAKNAAPSHTTVEGRCPVTGKTGPLPKGHPMPTNGTQNVNTTATGISAVTVGVPPEAVAEVTENHKCPFINVFASHIDSYIHRALMTSVLNRITLKSFLREKKVLQRFAINSSAIRKREDTSSAAAASDIGDVSSSTPNVLDKNYSEDIDESAINVLNLTTAETEEKCDEILKVYMKNGTARPRTSPAQRNDEEGDASANTNGAPKLTPAVAAILAAAAANAAHLPAARPTDGTTNPTPINIPGAAPASGTSTPTLKPRRIGEIGDDEDATVGATPSAVASMLSSMRLGREVSLPMALSFLNQATNRSEERFMDMYLRVVAEACGIKPAPLPPPLRPPTRMIGPDGQPNPAAMMVMVPSSSLLAKAIADGSLPSVVSAAAPQAQAGATPQGPPILHPMKTAVAAPPKTFLHDVLTSLFVPRMQHFYTLWLHAVEHYESLPASESPQSTVLNDALHRVNNTAQNVLHCIRCYSKMLHYHIMDPQSMKAVIDDLINKADQFVTVRKQKLQLAQMTHHSKVLPYPSAHRFFSLATILAIRESVPFRTFIAMETGDGAALRESIVAELIRGDKMLAQVPCENAASNALEYPLYAHATSLKNIIKTALYVTALATISPVAVVGNGNNGTQTLPNATDAARPQTSTMRSQQSGSGNKPPSPVAAGSDKSQKQQQAPSNVMSTQGQPMAASAMPFRPQQTAQPWQQVQMAPYPQASYGIYQPQIIVAPYTNVPMTPSHPFVVPFEPFMPTGGQTTTYLGGTGHIYANMPPANQLPTTQSDPQQHVQRSLVPPFYTSPVSPVPTGQLQRENNNLVADGVHAQAKKNMEAVAQQTHNDPALKCPFLRTQFPSGAPTIIPTCPHNVNERNTESVSPVSAGPGAIGSTGASVSASAAPFYPLQAPIGQALHNASNNPFALYYPVIQPQELIAPVYQPRGNGIALRPPPYKQ